MKAVPLTIAARLLNQVATTQLRVTISQYADTQPLWTFRPNSRLIVKARRKPANIIHLVTTAARTSNHHHPPEIIVRGGIMRASRAVRAQSSHNAALEENPKY